VVGGVFAMSKSAYAASVVPLVCKYTDSDGDGIWDHQDYCPNTPNNSKSHTDDYGCSREDVDPDDDEKCSTHRQKMSTGEYPPTPYCQGSDNCDFAHNPKQTNSVGDPERGDACNVGRLTLSAVWHHRSTGLWVIRGSRL
jgi:hypothetical protein